MRLSKTWVAAVVLVAFHGTSAPALAATATKYHLTEHFVIAYRARDYDAKNITDEDLRQWGGWLEQAYSRFTNAPKDGGLGFRKPVGTKALAGKPRLRVVIHTFAEHSRFQARGKNPGCAFHDGLIHLNLAYYGRDDRDDANKCTIAHEIFHLIQAAYDEEEERWLRESTARWSAGAAFPEIDQSRYCIPTELDFIRYAHLPLHFDVSGGAGYERQSAIRKKVGHPYGGSTLFRFLSKHAPAGESPVQRMFEECAAKKGPNGLEALAKALGGKEAMDARFRQVYDRFVVGCALNELAPADSHLSDAAKLKSGNERVMLSRVDLSPGWLEYCKTSLEKSPGSRDPAGYTPVFRAPPDLIKVIATGQNPGGSADPPGAVAAWIGGGGVRCFQIDKPEKLPDGLTLQVAVSAPSDELSVQGLIRYGKGKPVSVFKGGYDAAKKHYVLRFPTLKDSGARVFVLVTRYSTKLDAVNYPMNLALVEEGPGFYVKDARFWRYGPVTGEIKVLPPDSVAVKDRLNRPAWAQPYLIVVEIGSHRVYHYPSNVKEYWEENTLHYIQAGFFEAGLILRGLSDKLPDTMRVTAVFADGRRQTSEMPVPFIKFENEHLFTKQRDEDAEKARKDYAAAIKDPMKPTPILTAAHRLITNTRDAKEAEQVYESALRIIATQVKSEPARSRSGIMHAHLVGTRNRGDLKRYLEILEAIEKEGTVDRAAGKVHINVQDYPDAMQLVVAWTNDVEKAHELWAKFKELAAKLPEEERKKSLYASRLQRELGLPKKRISYP